MTFYETNNRANCILNTFEYAFLCFSPHKKKSAPITERPQSVSRNCCDTISDNAKKDTSMPLYLALSPIQLCRKLIVP